MKKLLVVGLAAVAISAGAMADDTVKLTAPEQQSMFNGAIEKFREAFRTAPNEMAAGAQRPKRGKAICAIVGKGAVKNWVGFVEEVSSNGDGYGVLTLQTGNGIKIGTWNNSLSDAGDNTLIDPDSAVFEQAVTLSVGQAVKFSGKFVRDKVDCVRDRSLTQAGSMEEPEYVMRFTAIEAVGDPPKKEDAKSSEGSILYRLFE